jgi:hypothetical protein
MSVIFHVVSARAHDDNLLVSGYIEGTVRVGTFFSEARKQLDYCDGKGVKLERPTNVRKVDFKVLKILAYDQELPESSGPSGHLLLEGSLLQSVEWGDCLVE